VLCTDKIGHCTSHIKLAYRPQPGIRAIIEVRASKPEPVLIRAELRQRQRTLTETALFILNAEG
jgi:hypothetical protein